MSKRHCPQLESHFTDGVFSVCFKVATKWLSNVINSHDKWFNIKRLFWGLRCLTSLNVGCRVVMHRWSQHFGFIVPANQQVSPEADRTLQTIRFISLDIPAPLSPFGQTALRVWVPTLWTFLSAIQDSQASFHISVFKRGQKRWIRKVNWLFCCYKYIQKNTPTNGFACAGAEPARTDLDMPQSSTYHKEKFQNTIFSTFS